MRALDVKLLRDLKTLAGPAVAIAFVVAGGVLAHVMLRGTYSSLVEARDGFYSRTRFADLFVRVERAPRSVLAELAQLEGVETVDGRVSEDIVVDVPGMAEPARGLLTTLPDVGEPPLDLVVLRSGRLPEAGRLEEVLVGEAFAEAHQLGPGARLEATLGARRVALRVVGVAVSAEQVYVVPPGSIWPDDRRYGVFWTTQTAAAAALGYVGAFNDLVLKLRAGADAERVKAELDRRLARYGGLGTADRKAQLSHRFVDMELQQLENQTVAVPVMFLGVAALILHLVLSRLVESQRQTLALLKAVGYPARAVAWHYVKLALLIVLVGVAVGVVGGDVVGDAFIGLYRPYYRFDVLEFHVDRPSAVAAAAMSLVAGAVGALSAVRRVLALQPAEAMQPPAPPAFARGLVDRLGLTRVLGPRARMVVRQLVKRPARTAFTILGLSLAVGLLVVVTVMEDAVSFAMNLGFLQASREDLEVALARPRPRGPALAELSHLPGVLLAEPELMVPARLRNGHRSYETAVIGRAAGGELRRQLDEHERVLPALPPEGLVLTAQLAEKLGLAPGDELEVERLDGDRRTVRARLAGLSREAVGLSAEGELGAVNRLFGESDVINGALLLVDPAREAELSARLKALPLVAGASFRLAALATFRRLMAEVYTLIRMLLGVFATLMALGIVYNAGRIALAERSRELATLRVLGFTRREVSGIFSGEQLALLVMAMPLGWAVGRGLTAALLASLSAGELFRLTAVTTPDVYLIASAIVVAASLLTALITRRRLARLDLVAVLKARE